jgi:hypothetical protein
MAKKETLSNSAGQEKARSAKIGRPLPIKFPEVFNPYDKDSYLKEGKKGEDYFSILKPVATIQNKLFDSSGMFYDSKTDSISVYKIYGDVAVLQVNINRDYSNKSYMAFAYYDKELLDENTMFRSEEQYKTENQMWHFGAIAKKDMNSKEDWLVVPREIFKNINDYVYLCVCTEKNQGEPVVKGISFPTDRLFFYDLPVATSVYEGQQLKDSKIILGKVMRYVRSRKSAELGKASIKLLRMRKKYRVYSGEFKWLEGDKKILIEGTSEFENRSIKDYKFCCNGKLYNCPKIELNIYKKTPEVRKRDIAAFVWQSGNEDDEVKKSYFGGGTGSEHPYNKYSYIMDCLSSHTMYRSMVSLTKFTASNAARYAVRTLAKQPKGNRCFSIDGNNLVFLMGGALFKIEHMITHTPIVNDKHRNLDGNELDFADGLYAINGSHLFFDNPVNYEKNGKDKATYYIKDVLGIKPGSNGCEAIKKLLTSLFDEIKQYGIELDYVYCDIEGPWNDARALLSRRFNEKYFVPKSMERKEFYNTVVLNELMGRNEIWEDMRHRGLDISVIPLSDICVANDNQDNPYSFYGLNQTSYVNRRNPNIWDAVMKGYGNDLFYHYVMQPVLNNNPKAKCSVFAHDNAKGYVNHASRFETYLGGTVNLHPDLYSCEAIYGGISGEYYKKLCMDNWKMFPNRRTLFSDFVGSINALRSPLVSSQSNDQKNGKFNVFFSSFNIWVNNYIDNTQEDEKADVIQQIKTGGNLKKRLEVYYKEFLYHVFLCCPDRAIAYFQVERKAIKDNGTVNNGGSYFFPFGNGQNLDSFKEYYSDSYSKLQEILEELNGLVKGNVCETMVKSLATETEPYVISGVKLNDRKLWRVTMNEPVDPIDNGIDVVINTSNGKKIKFAKKQKVIVGEYGLWVETPLNVEPEIISIADYYESNPAFVSQIDYGLIPVITDSNDYGAKIRSEFKQFALVNVTNILRFARPKTYTVFGETPEFMAWSMKFKVNRVETASTILLWRPNELLDLYLSGSQDNLEGLNVRTEKATEIVRIIDGEEKTIRKTKPSKIGKEKLVVGGCYELRKYVALMNGLSGTQLEGMVRYELWKLTGNGDKHLVFDDERCFENKILKDAYAYQTYMELLYPITDVISIEEFKVFLSQQHEKLELFRESDGVNIGRVNNKVDAYKALPVETRRNDTLVGKFSWVNATNEDVEYTISYKMNGKTQKIDSQFSKIRVKANSEGCIMIPLPVLKRDTTHVEIVCEKPVKNNVLQQGQTSFFVNYYNQHRIKAVSVDIIP